ncbi:MAG: NimC/NimA family protein [Clostridiales bacterium]|nr:NimC/NimA family protein [Clostridiales bacterium]
MSKIYDFLLQCGTFFVLTVNDNCPEGRPFGAVMEFSNKLFVATSNKKDVYKQMKNNPNVQLISLKAQTRNWLRASGIATECFDKELKVKMFDACPILNKHYGNPDCEFFAMFQIEVSKATLNLNGEIFQF